MKSVTKLMLLMVVLLVAGFTWLYLRYSNEEILSTLEKTQTLSFADGKKIYVRSKVWGVSGNHQEIVFSETPITSSHKENDYIFYTDEVFYKIDNNTLVLYAPESSKNIPKIPFSDVEVIFKGLKTASEIKDCSINYQKYSLSKISVYQ